MEKQPNELNVAPIFYTQKKRKSTPRLIWSTQAIIDFKAKYPTYFNSDLALEFNCDVRTVLRKAREFGLEKTVDFVKTNKEEMVRRSLRAKEIKRMA